MTIAKRIALLVAVALFGLLLVGGVGLRQMSSISGNLQYAHENSIPSIKKIDDIESTFLRLRIHILAYLLSGDENRPGLEKQIGERKLELEKHIKDYEPLISDEKDKGYLDKTKELLKAYYPLLDNALAATKAGQPDQAKAGIGQAAIISKALAENIDAHSVYNEKLAEAEVGKALASYDTGYKLAILIVIAVAGLTGTMGFLVYRHVEGSLGEMVRIFSQIEKTLDFTGRLPVKGTDEVAKASLAFNRLLERLQNSLREIADNTAAVNTAAGSVANAAREMSIASEQQSEAASSMAATVEQMTVSISHVADRAHEANRLSVSSGDQAKDGLTIIGRTVDGIHSIDETVRAAAQQIELLESKSERINHVVTVIKEVADQTNLLALNAAIEAARAGEQGRGFAVVADEVRKLAERTTQSTAEIGQTITEMQVASRSAVGGVQEVVGKVEVGVETAQRANEVVQAIGSSSREAEGMVGEISEAIREQSEASTSIAQQVERIAQMAEENSAASGVTSDSAQDLARLAAAMQRVVAQYKV